MASDLHMLLKRAANGGHPQGLPKTFDALLRVPRDHLHYEVSQRATALWVLARTARPQAVPVLLASLGSRSTEIRGAAARGLGELGIVKPGVIEALVRRLRRDPESTVREAAAYALGLLGDRVALRPLLEILADQEEVENVRAMATEAIVDLARPEAVGELQTILDSIGSHTVLAQEIRAAIRRLRALQ